MWHGSVMICNSWWSLICWVVVDQLDVVIGLVSLGDDDLIRCVMVGVACGLRL